MTYDIQVEITNIQFDTKYFSFNYKIMVGEKLHKEDLYSSDHAWADNIDEFKQLLNTGYALNLALENF